MYLRSVGTKLWDRPNKESMNPPTQGGLAGWPGGWSPYRTWGEKDRRSPRHGKTNTQQGLLEP